MTMLILGLVLFIGIHLVRVVADGWRTQLRSRYGENRYKGIYSVISIVGFVLICWGYGKARVDSPTLWAAPLGLYHLTAALMLVSMVLLAGFHVRQSHISVKVHHPMLWATVVFSFAHLLVNGRVADLLLFGSFLAWSVLDLISCYGRDATNQVAYPAPLGKKTVVNLIVGVLLFIVFAGFLHKWLIGVSPIPGH